MCKNHDISRFDNDPFEINNDQKRNEGVVELEMPFYFSRQFEISLSCLGILEGVCNQEYIISS